MNYTAGKECYAPCIQLIVFLLFIIFWLIYQSNFFGNKKFKKYNKFCLMMAIVLGFWFITLFIRWNFRIPETSDVWFKTPDWINTFVGEPRCESNGVDFWTIGHFVFWTIVGAIVPGLYVEVIIISILYEVFENMVGAKSQFIIDPIANLMGYTLGSALSLKD